MSPLLPLVPPLPLRAVREHHLAPADRTVWPATLAPVREILDEGLELGQVTVLTGDNGAGKSTLVEAIAGAYGLNPEGGGTGAMHATRATESPLAEHLQLVRGAGAAKSGFFLRAETMHSLFTYYEEIGVGGMMHERSHGESFLELVTERSRIRGLWLLDEPESALSLPGCLALLGLLRELVENGSQILLSTHSPVLAALPGAELYEVGEWGLRRTAYDDLTLVRTWRSFLDAPQRFLRHLD
ncbi:ATP-binding cassette domain-containing protein [uncultured Brachybacterium sp.]|uniref:AAA family ATPase n=1 Tax=uncultured Brachybacterium sp. TaxID=189680 RepID=UPI0026297255|nr:ATP-binding cassette domain-containing protein [uncultured Brachybacterium sp.]